MTESNKEVGVLEAEPEVEVEEKGFIKHPELLEEDYRVDDLLDFSEIIGRFTQKLDSIHETSIVGLVGEYGSGKSTMLYQIQKARKAEEVWISFDAWKYPERKDLWEGFVLDFAHQIGEREKVRSKIDGTSKGNKGLDITAGIVGLIPVVGSGDKLFDVFKSPKMKRVFELQEILQGLINCQTQNIVIVVEDIDRSGDSGVYFLETLKHFLKNTDFNKRVLAIVPVADEKYNKHIQSYMKCFDYTVTFSPKDIGLTSYVENTFSPSLFEGEKKGVHNKTIWTGAHKKGQVVSFLEFILAYPNMNLRVLKSILRESNSSFLRQTQDGCQPDWRVTICFDAAKFIDSPDTPRQSFFDKFAKEKKIQNNCIFANFIVAMIGNYPSIYVSHDKKELIIVKYDIDCITRPKGGDVERQPSYPWYYHGNFEGDKKGFAVCDFYLE